MDRTLDRDGSRSAVRGISSRCANGQVRTHTHIADTPGPGCIGRAVKNSRDRDLAARRTTRRLLCSLQRNVPQRGLDARYRGAIEITHMNVRLNLPTQQFGLQAIRLKRAIRKFVLALKVPNFQST